MASAQLVPGETQEFKKGAELARQYCAGCHLFPEPDLMDKSTWRNGTMPFLKNRLGIDRLNPADPAQKSVMDEWDLVWTYYLAAAPERPLPAKERAPIEMGLPQFKVVNPGYRPGQQFVTLVQIDSTARQLYVGNGKANTLDVLDSAGKSIGSLPVKSPPVALARRSQGWFCTLIGRLPPHDQALGEVWLLDKSERGFSKRTELVKHLPRPVHCAFGDLNGDGREDLIISGFGNITGDLSAYLQVAELSYRPHMLYDRPGAVRTELADVNQDGRLDLIAMMAQAKEGIYMLLNQGNGGFAEVPVAEQHPAWGYSGFQWVDFNRDGAPDILATNGDNGEYLSCLKNYHGIRLYLNNGKYQFQESFTYPLNGAFKAIAADFDQDSDMDIAAISYFPDYENAPEESFVYLENRGGLTFKARTFEMSKLGRWLVMDAGDLDGDGDLDIALGAANRTPYQVDRTLYDRWTKDGPTILILENTKVR